MRAVHENIDGPFAIEEDIALYGTIAGDFIIEPGARAIIHGTVAARVNEGGRAEIFGMVDAVENLSPDAASIIDPVAHVRGRP